MSLMTIPFYDSKRVHNEYESLLEASLLNDLSEGQYISGKKVKVLETSLQDFLDIEHCITCANGSEALTIAIKALEIEIDSEVIIPSFNYISAAESATLCQLKPVFCDVSSLHFNTTLTDIKLKISAKTKLVIVTHMFGLPVEDIQEIANYCKEKGIFLIEDNAQSFGSKINNQYAGTFGDISTTSFFPTKNLGAIGDGGAIFTSNNDLAKKIKALASHGQSTKYHFDYCGFNSRLDTLQAGILIEKLAFLPSDLEKRKVNAYQYLSELKDVKGIQLPQKENNTFNQFSILVTEKNRDKLASQLKTLGIQPMIYYPLGLHKQKAFSNLEKCNLAQTEMICSSILSLPIFPGLRNDEISYICSSLKNICG